MKVLVCGGRDFTNTQLLVEALLEVHKLITITLVIHGAAKGADSMAGEWARAMGIKETPFPADWDRYRNRAGPVRNQRMLDVGKPDLVVAFAGGAGTLDMVRKARAAGVRVADFRKL